MKLITLNSGSDCCFLVVTDSLTCGSFGGMAVGRVVSNNYDVPSSFNEGFGDY